ncbi:RNA-directed DNA polymerase, eukaryota, reverse transcriptase zinc-binding domain protein [Tanacetum coccineum]
MFIVLRARGLLHGIVVKMVNLADNSKYSVTRLYFIRLWLDIVREVKQFKNRGTDLIGFIHKKMGNGANTSFWEDTWRGDVAFKSLYRRVYALESCKSVTIASKLSHENVGYSLRRVPRGGAEQVQFLESLANVKGISLAAMRDMWAWSLKGSGEFSVASVRKLIDDRMLPEVSPKTRWIIVVPIKVNVHVWKVRLDCLPTMLNISRRGMNIEFILFPICGKEVESSSHIFFACQIVREVFRKITCWWDVNLMEVSSYEEWLDWLLKLRLHYKYKQLLERVCYIMWWLIWIFRNKSIFGSDLPSKAMLFDDVVARAFYWCLNRCKASFSWID